MAEFVPRDIFLESLERCAASDKFLSGFYSRFMGSSDEVRKKFQYTDMEKQQQMLLKSLRVAAGATAGERESLQELHERAQTHDRWHHNIEPRLYEFWLEALIATARTVDEEWSATVEASWRSILGHVIKHMAKDY